MNQKQLLDRTVKMFLAKCTSEGAFPNKKLNSAYFPLRNFLQNIEPIQLQHLYDYLNQLEVKSIQTLTEVFRNSEKLRLNIIKQDDKQKAQTLNVKPYKEYDLSDIMNL